MRQTLAALLAAATCLATAIPAAAQNAASMPIATLEASIADMHPSAYFNLASRLFADGRRDRAVEWLYIAQIRYRFHLAANPGLPAGGDPALFASLMETVARPINEYAGGNVDDWLRAIDAALAWDAANPNGFTSKTTHAGALSRTREGLRGLRTSLDRDRAGIRATRERNGLSAR